MVATKSPAPAGAGPQVGNKRRGGFNGGAPNRQRFKPGGKQLNPRAMGAAAMFTVNQLDDNPGFLDFNEDVQIPPAPAQKAASAAESTSTEVAATSGEGGKGKGGPNRKANPNQKRFRNGNMRRMPPGGPGPFCPPPPPFRAPRMMAPNGRFCPGPMPMMPPRPYGRFCPGPMPPPRPMMPMFPMHGGPWGWGGPNGWNGPPMRRNPNGKLPPGGGRPGKIGGPKGAVALRNGKGPKVAPGKKGAKSKEPAKPREEYPLDQPWVTDEIKAEHDKKVQLADRLKGNRDDALFAQFKEQRDKFVKMYDAAKLEFIGKHPEQDVDKIMTESEEGPTTKPEPQSSSDDAVSTDTSAATTATTTTTTSTASSGKAQ